MCVPVGEKEAEDKELNSEAPSSLSEAASEKEANSVSQSNAVSTRKEEERSNSIKKVGCHFEDCLDFEILTLIFTLSSACGIQQIPPGQRV